jgi:hypothetical protein
MHILHETADATFKRPMPPRQCPACGSAEGEFALVYEGDQMVGGLHKLGVRAAERRRRFDEGFEGVEVQRSTRRLVYRTVQINRSRDEYVERIVVVDTGEVLVDKKERLSDHTDRGSARQRPSPSAPRDAE